MLHSEPVKVMKEKTRCGDNGFQMSGIIYRLLPVSLNSSGLCDNASTVDHCPSINPNYQPESIVELFSSKAYPILDF